MLTTAGLVPLDIRLAVIPQKQSQNFMAFYDMFVAALFWSLLLGSAVLLSKRSSRYLSQVQSDQIISSDARQGE